MARRIGISYRVGPIGLFFLLVVGALLATGLALLWAAIVAFSALWLVGALIVWTVQERRKVKARPKLPKLPKAIAPVYQPRHYARPY